MGYKTDTDQLADSMAHFVSSQWSIIGRVLFSTRNRNIRISCPFSCYYLMWQHRILIHSQSGLIIGGYWGFMALGHMKPNQNPVVWKLKATCSESPGQCDNVTMWQNHFVAQKNAASSYISTYLHVSPRISTCSSYISENHGAAAGNFRFNTSHPRSCPQPSLNHSFRF